VLTGAQPLRDIPDTRRRALARVSANSCKHHRSLSTIRRDPVALSGGRGQAAAETARGFWSLVPAGSISIHWRRFYALRARLRPPQADASVEVEFTSSSTIRARGGLIATAVAYRRLQLGRTGGA
jgi:hypothetical protein